MSFKDNIPGVLVRAFEQVATHSGVYNESGSDPVTCELRLDHDVVLQPSSYDTRVVETGTTITALYRDVGEPTSGSTFTVDSDVWEVKRVTDNDKTFVTVAVILV